MPLQKSLKLTWIVFVQIVQLILIRRGRTLKHTQTHISNCIVATLFPLSNGSN